MRPRSAGSAAQAEGAGTTKDQGPASARTRGCLPERVRSARCPGVPLCASPLPRRPARPSPALGPTHQASGRRGSARSLSNSGRGAGKQRPLAAPVALKGRNAGRPLAAIYSPFIPLACTAGWCRCFVLRPQLQTTPQGRPPCVSPRWDPGTPRPPRPAPAQDPEAGTSDPWTSWSCPTHRGKLRQESHPALEDARARLYPASAFLCQSPRWRGGGGSERPGQRGSSFCSRYCPRPAPPGLSWF